MMRNCLWIIALVFAATVVPTELKAQITYTVNKPVGTGSVTGYITTDGTIGTLSTSNIVGWALELNDGINMVLLTPADSSVSEFAQSALTATVNELSWDFTFNENTGSSLNFRGIPPNAVGDLCFSFYCTPEFNPGVISISDLDSDNAYVYTVESGPVVIASVTHLITVTDTTDSSPNSLRAAIAAANPGDTIDFSLQLPATIILTSGELLINKNLTIRGPGASNLAISGNNTVQVFSIGGGITVTISGVTIENGTAGSNNGGGINNAGKLMLRNSTLSGNSALYGNGTCNSGCGGGIWNQGTLTVSNSTLSGNTTNFYGGGIFNTGTLTVTNSTLSGNSDMSGIGYGGGGIFNAGPLTVSNSTLSGNSVASSAGNAGGIWNQGTLTMSNSTLSGNSAGNGGGIFNNSSGTMTITNSTLSGNLANNNGSDIFNSASATLKNSILATGGPGAPGNCYGSFTSQGHNLSDDNSCSLTGTGDLNNTPAGLNPVGLQKNGGPTQTIALLATSPAVNAIPLSPTNYCTDVNSAPITADQRGFARPQGSACDIGAFETVDDNAGFAQLNSSDTFNGNQTVNGNVTATNFAGSGAGLTGVNAASLGSVSASNYARLDIGNLFSGNQNVNGNVTASAFIGDGSNLTNITASTANFANSATMALSAGNSSSLGGFAASNYARLDIGNALNGNQSIINGNLALDNTNSTSTGITGVITLGGRPFLSNFGTNNTFVGQSAGSFNNTIGQNNTATGAFALSANTTGYNNTASGFLALQNNTNGFNNTASGLQALQGNTGGGFNTAFGYALIYNTTGSNNTAVGFQAGVNENGLNANTTGSNNTFLGYSSGPQTPTQLNNATAIGANAVVNASNALILGSINGVNGATSNVNVGIGTAAPAYALDVQGGQINASGGLCIAGTCQTSWPQGGGGSITGVTAGMGLTGGGAQGNVLLSVDNTVARTNASNAFSGDQSVHGTVTAAAFSGDGSALTNVNALTAATAATATTASALGGIGAGNFARLDIPNAFNGDQSIAGNMNLGGNLTTPGNITVSGTSGIFTGSVSISGVGGVTAGGNTGQVAGTFINNANTNSNDALFAEHTGFGPAIHGVDTQYDGTAALFEATAPGRATRALVATDASPAGVAGVLKNTAGGEILSLQNGSGEVSSVDGNGIFHFAPGQVFPGTGSGTISGVTAGSGLTGGGTSGNVGLSVNEGVVAFQSDLTTGINAAESFATSAASSAVSTAETYASSTFLPLAGGTLTGNLVGTGANFSGTASANQFNALGSYLLGGVPVLNASDTQGGPPNGDFGGDVSVGIGAGPVSSNVWNTYVGNDAGQRQPASNVVSNNTFVGHFAGGGATSGSQNSFFGAVAGSGTTGSNNTFLGYGAGGGVSTGSNNTMIGSFAGGISGPYGSQNVYLGASINPPLNESNAIRIGVSGTQNAAYIAGVYGGGTSNGVPVYVDASGHFGTGGGSVIGTITGVTAGSGLTGGGASGNVSLSIPSAGVTNAMLANSSLTVTAGAGLTGGGPVALGGTATVSLATNTCAAGSAVTAHPFTCSPFATLGVNRFSGGQVMPNLTIAGGQPNALVVSTTGVGSIGVLADSPSNVAVEGQSNTGDGVAGFSSSGLGVVADSTSGSGLSSQSSSTASTTAAAILDNTGSTNAGNILLGQYNGTNEFIVDAKGDVTASGSVTIGGGTPITQYQSATISITVPSLGAGLCTTLSKGLPTGITTAAAANDTIALGIPDLLMAVGGEYGVIYQAWESGTIANTIMIQVCRVNANGKPTVSTTGTIRIDIFKH
jgi:hypothetical protein